MPPAAPLQNDDKRWVYFKVDAELEMSGYHPMLEVIYGDTTVEDSFPSEVGCCEDILCTPSCEKDVRITFPLTIWSRIEKETAECTSDLEVRGLMEEAILNVPEDTCMGCPVTLRNLTVTRQDSMDSEYREYLDFVGGKVHGDVIDLARSFLRKPSN